MGNLQSNRRAIYDASLPDLLQSWRFDNSRPNPAHDAI